MGRLYWYAGISAVLAGGVIISAFNQRANFYSACVYLSQSNLCLMILINLILFVYSLFMYGLQRICYGALRPIEVEQLYEKAWFAITETCLAMTMFREEVGAWFLVMFVALLTGKVWGWIGDGRVEVLEQQPPANPRLFHLRLSISLLLSILYDCWLMSYIINTVIQQARPNMMVMFLFEFAILTSSSFSTVCRYALSLVEADIVKKQTQSRLLERRAEVRQARLEMIAQREAEVASAIAESREAPTFNEPLPSEDDVEEMDIEVSGWEAKGQWVLSLDLVTDFLKLGIYLVFLIILLTFYGLPIHIMRDLFMTTRSFLKRLTAFVRYRRATQDMNAKYADATVEDLEREDTCIICREEMRAWSVTNPPGAPDPANPGVAPAAPTTNSASERSRPKKLPCGHILHLGCLKSWLERQQVCPTCRRSVTDLGPSSGPTTGNNPNAVPAGAGAQAALPPQQDAPREPGPQAAQGGRRGLRVLNLGPFRVGFGQANLQDMANGFGGQLAGQDARIGGNARVYGLELGFPRRRNPQPQEQNTSPEPVPRPTQQSVQSQLLQLEDEIMAEVRSMHFTQQEFDTIRMLQLELSRLRALRQNAAEAQPGSATVFQPSIQPVTYNVTPPAPQMQRHAARANVPPIAAGSPELPEGVVIPEGWTLLPLSRLDETTTPGSLPFGLPHLPLPRVSRAPPGSAQAAQNPVGAFPFVPSTATATFTTNVSQLTNLSPSSTTQSTASSNVTLPHVATTDGASPGTSSAHNDPTLNDSTASVPAPAQIVSQDAHPPASIVPDRGEAVSSDREVNDISINPPEDTRNAPLEEQAHTVEPNRDAEGSRSHAASVEDAEDEAEES